MAGAAVGAGTGGRRSGGRSARTEPANPVPASWNQEHTAECLPALDVGMGFAGLGEGKPSVDDHP